MKKNTPLEEMFEPKVYDSGQLQDFHNKIQRFWETPREVRLEGGMSGTAQKFNHQELAVSFGAAIKVKHGLGYVYKYSHERYLALENLWRQHEDWRKKQDWIEDKQNEELEKVVEQIPF